MNIVADECVDRSVVDRLREDGHDVVYVRDQSPGVTDDDVLLEANQRGALLITADRDFGDMVFRQRLIHLGVVLLRLAGLSNPAKARLVAEVLRDHGPDLIGAFAVVAPGQVRIRREP